MPEAMERNHNRCNSVSSSHCEDTSDVQLRNALTAVTNTNDTSELDSVISPESLEQSMIPAVEHGDLSSVTTCLQDPLCNVNAADDRGLTALMLVAQRAERGADSAQIMRELLAHEQIDVNRTDHRGWTALHHGVFQPSPVAVELLVNCKSCDVNIQLRTGKTALMGAAERVQSDDDNYSKIINLLLLRESINTDLMDDRGLTVIDVLLRREFLCNANFDNHCFLWRKISQLTNKATTDADFYKHTLAEAISYNPISVCEVLLTHCFSPNDAMKPSSVLAEADALFGTRHSEGRETALHRAVRLDSLSKSKLLLEHNADVDCGNKWRGLTPLELAIAYNVRPEISELLSKNMLKCEIAEAIEKCSMVGESVQECVLRLGVRAWARLFNVFDQMTIVSHCIPKITSSKLSVNTFYNSGDALTAVKSCRVNFKGLESQLILREVTTLLEMVSDIVADRIPGLRFVPILAGSMAEGTKVYLPNEVDVMCVIGPNFRVNSSINGNTFELVCDGSLRECINNDGKKVHSSKFVELFYSAVEFALQRIANVAGQSGNLRLFKRSLIWCDKVSRLQLMWNGEEFKNMMISVDLAVCVPMDRETAEVHHNNIAKLSIVDEYFVICKSARYHKDSYPALSTSNLENELLYRLPINAKRGLILAKAVRIASIAKPGEDLSTAFCLAEDVHIDDLISSHILKSCLMFICGCVHPIDSSPCCNIFMDFKIYRLSAPIYSVTPYDIVIGIYRFLKHQLKQKVLFSWISNDKRVGRLLDCEECKVNHGCCMKRKLMLAMTQNILDWLQDNEAQLQDIDYADGVDHCHLKELVHLRPDVIEVLCGATIDNRLSDAKSVDYCNVKGTVHAQTDALIYGEKEAVKHEMPELLASIWSVVRECDFGQLSRKMGMMFVSHLRQKLVLNHFDLDQAILTQKHAAAVDDCVVKTLVYERPGVQTRGGNPAMHMVSRSEIQESAQEIDLQSLSRDAAELFLVQMMTEAGFQ